MGREKGKGRGGEGGREEQKTGRKTKISYVPLFLE